MEKLMIIDGNSIISRAFYGIRLLSTKDGFFTNALVGFFNILGKILEEEQPDGLCVCFDLKGKTFRHEAFEDYKAGRKETPAELVMQIPLLKEILDAMGIARCEKEGFEADDLLGSISRACEEANIPALLVTGDRDSLQLVGNGTTLRYIATRGGKTETTLYDQWKIQLDFGIEPAQFIDIKALMGDASDNIPGVPGVGEKTAFALIHEFGSVENVYNNLNSPEIRPAVRQKLTEGESLAKLSYSLAEIDRTVPFDCALAEMKIGEPDAETLVPLLERLEMKSLLAKLNLSSPAKPPAKPLPSLPKAVDLAIFDGASAALSRLAAEKNTVFLAFAEDAAAWETAFLATETEIFRLNRSAFSETQRQEIDLALFSADLPKGVLDSKSLYHTRLSANLPAEGLVFDALLAGYLQNFGQNLSEIAEKLEILLPEKTDETEAAWEAYALHALAAPLLRLLDAENMRKLYDEIELPLAKVMAEMEILGFGVDKAALSAFGEELALGIARTEAEIFRLAGREFNLNSPKQLGAVLFDEMGLPTGKKTKTGYSTNADVLNALRPYHEIIPQILEYRLLSKLKSTFVDGLLKEIAPDGRIRSHLHQTGTVTGRISSSEPNLQNIPVRSEIGSRLREMFCASPGHVLVDADYSQIELRVLAHIAGDARMKEAFAKGEDIHSATAALVFDVPLDQVSSEQRSRAKAVNFGIVYGISDFSLSEDIGTTRKEARWIIDRYLEKYHGVMAYMAEIVAFARENGYVETLWHRRRFLPDIDSRNFNRRTAAERTALNTPIQGTAADIIKMAMVRVARRLRKEGLAARLILQVHDELIVEAPESESAAVQAILTEEMESAMELSVKLSAESGAGKTWAEAKG